MDKKSIIILGYGNPSRRDDRVGWYIIDELSSRIPSYIRLEKLHQLEIEWSETIQEYDLVIFIDAHMSETDDWIRVIELNPAFEMTTVSHHMSPTHLLGLCQLLYHRIPRGVLFSVKGTDFNFGTELSGQTKESADQTISMIIDLVMTGELKSQNLNSSPSILKS